MYNQGPVCRNRILDGTNAVHDGHKSSSTEYGEQKEIIIVTNPRGRQSVILSEAYKNECDWMLKAISQQQT